MPQAVLGFGSNLGARRAIFACAEQLLADQPGCRVLARSPLYASPALVLAGPQPDYLNAALRVDWVGQLEGLFALTRHVEHLLGRERRERWGARTLDIDILYWSEGELDTPELQVPHPGLLQRSFALAPLLEVLPELRARWGHTLRALGGPPVLAVPGWLGPADLPCAWPGNLPLDAAELASLVVGTVGACAKTGTRARGCLSFAGPGVLFDAHGRSWLEDRVALSYANGFAVIGGAITQISPERVSGVLIGEHTGAALSPNLPTVCLTRAADGAAQVRVSSPAVA